MFLKLICVICAFQSFAIFKFLPSVGAWSINSIVLYYCIGPRPSELYGKFTWRIDNFSQINRSELRSNSFDVGGYKWYCLFVCINWTHHLLFIFFLLPACFYYVVSGLLTCLLGVIWLLVFSDFTRNTSCSVPLFALLHILFELQIMKADHAFDKWSNNLGENNK
jgi:hypothetical protein